jgi:hypothetical protein
VRRIGWAQLIFATAVVAVMLSWGLFAIFWTSPNEVTIVQDALYADGNRLTINAFNVTAGSEARFTIFFQTNIPANVSSEGHVDGENVAFGPVPWATPNVTFLRSELEYAVFTLEYTLHNANGGGYTQTPTTRYSGPQGNLTASNFYSTFVGEYTASAVEAASPGNYTLHFLNKPSTNATGRITMGWSRVTHSNSRPYLYDGFMTIGLAGAFSITTVYVSWKRIPPARGSTEKASNL